MSDGEQIRACLWCGKKFASTGPGNRKCGTCRKRQSAYRVVHVKA